MTAIVVSRSEVGVEVYRYKVERLVLLLEVGH